AGILDELVTGVQTCALPISALAVSLTCPLACSDPPFDTTRKTDPRGTLGEEAYKLLHTDLERDDDRRAKGFEIEHDAFVGTVDQIGRASCRERVTTTAAGEA